jgi:predicted 3-demethylubiquinone-9 3-methyltransferase (glyoxalase superfamily)
MSSQTPSDIAPSDIAPSSLAQSSPVRAKIAPCLWFADEAEEAARLYVSLLPDSRIDRVQRNSADSPAGKAGSVLVVEFTLAGLRFLALNGGKRADFSYAVSFQIDCEDQAEVDRLWDALLEGGGKPSQCGWLSDRWGVPWQVVPRALPRLLGDPDRAKAARVMQAMMGMVKLDVAGLEKAAAG